MENKTAAALPGSLLKGLALLETLSLSSTPCGVAQLARTLQMSKGGVHRLLQALKDAGWVRQTSDSAYACTLRVWEVGARLLEHGGLRSFALVHLRALWENTQETAYLAVLDGADALYLEKIDSPRRVLASFRVGDRLPAHRVAAGRALLAYAHGESPPQTSDPSDSMRSIRQSLEHDLAQIRARGFAINHGELDQSIRGIAAPVFNATGVAVASIGFSCPSERATPDSLMDKAEVVVHAARGLARDLGYVPGKVVA